MKVSIRKIQDKEQEQVIVDCVAITPEVVDIRNYVLNKGKMLSGSCEGNLYQFPLTSVFYFEAVDEHVFAYTSEKVYEVKQRLYELEKEYQNEKFLRCSKSILLNLMKLECISPALNGRFQAHLKNNEKIIISRQYVPELKKVVLGKE